MLTDPLYLWFLIGVAGGVLLGGCGLWLAQLGSRRAAAEAAVKLQQQSEELRHQLTEAQLTTARDQERLEQMTRLDRQLDERDEELRALQQENAQMQGELRALQTRLEDERSKQAEKLALLEQAGGRMQSEFRQLAQQIFEENSQRFGSQQQEKMDILLRPLRDQLVEFRRRVDDVYDKEAKDRRGLSEQVEQLKQLNLRMSEEAVNLTKALKGDNKAQGNWGEVVLARVLEESGLRQGHEYELQASRRNHEGHRYQPDVLIHLPDGKDVIVDAKMTLVAYERFSVATDETEAAAAMAAHLQAVRRHVNQLSEKAYSELEGVRSLDFVLLFMPVEAAFMLAIEQDRALFADAFSKNIVLVSPSTLLVTLKTIHHIWRNEKQNRHALEIARQGGELYTKFVGFVEALDDVGRSLAQAQRSYDTAHKRLTSGRGSLVNRVEGLTALGVRARKSLPESVRRETGDAEPRSE